MKLFNEQTSTFTSWITVHLCIPFPHVHKQRNLSILHKLGLCIVHLFSPNSAILCFCLTVLKTFILMQKQSSRPSFSGCLCTNFGFLKFFFSSSHYFPFATISIYWVWLAWWPHCIFYDWYCLGNLHGPPGLVFIEYKHLFRLNLQFTFCYTTSSNLASETPNKKTNKNGKVPKNGNLL